MPVQLATQPPAKQTPSMPGAEHADLRARITLARTSPRDIKQRQVFARLDHGPRIALVFDETHTLDLQPGRHRLKVHNTLMWKTIDFSVELGEHVQFQFVNRANWLTLTTLMWLGSGPLYLSVERTSLR